MDRFISRLTGWLSRPPRLTFYAVVTATGTLVGMAIPLAFIGLAGG